MIHTVSKLYRKRLIIAGSILGIACIVAILLRIYRIPVMRSFIVHHEIRGDLSMTQRYDLLGASENKKYLIALMNTNERKPDGGFFGSYAIVDIGPRTLSVDFFDSYYPQTIRDARVSVPEWFSPVLDIQEMGFLGINMIGRTQEDGENIASLYKQTFDQELDAVIFFKMDMLYDLLPDFQRFVWKQQFHNATIDLIRGEDRSNKKELFFADMRALLSPTTMLSIYQSMTPELLSAGYIRAFVPDASPELSQWLTDNNMIQDGGEDTILLFDYNLGFNKIDEFVEKTYTIKDEQGNEIMSGEGDVVTATREPGFYVIDITYTVAITQDYLDYIHGLTEEYGITLGRRENTILSLDPQWINRGVAYIPQSQIQEISGADDRGTYSYPDGEYIVYEILTKQFPLQQTVSIRFEKKEKK